MPAILSAVIMTFSKAMGTFGVPSVLGLKIGYYTVSTTMYNSIQNGQNRVAFAISLILIAIASFSVFLNQKAIGSRKSFSTIGGKGSRSNPIRLGKWRPVIVGILIAFIAVAVVFPVVILLYLDSLEVQSEDGAHTVQVTRETAKNTEDKQRARGDRLG